MRCTLVRGGWLLVILAGAGCAKPRIVGKTTFVDDAAAANAAGTPASGVTLNFINLEGKLEESVTSAQSDVKGNYTSTELPPAAGRHHAVWVTA